jgi:hypothetical protein
LIKNQMARSSGVLDIVFLSDPDRASGEFAVNGGVHGPPSSDGLTNKDSRDEDSRDEDSRDEDSRDEDSRDEDSRDEDSREFLGVRWQLGNGCNSLNGGS